MCTWCMCSKDSQRAQVIIKYDIKHACIVTYTLCSIANGSAAALSNTSSDSKEEEFTDDGTRLTPDPVAGIEN